MNKYGSRSSVKLSSLEDRLKLGLIEHLPTLSAKELTNYKQSAFTSRQSKTLLSSPLIEKSKKNLLLMKKFDQINQHSQHSSSSQSSHIIKRLQSGKQSKLLPQLQILKANTDKKNYLKHPLIRQSLIGEQAIQKFYQRYKDLEKRKEKQDFFNDKHVLTNIVSLLQMHNFTPRKLTLVKLKGQEAILDLKKLGIGQGSLGPVITEIMNYLQKFEEVDISYNRIDSLLGEAMLDKLGKVKKINLSHNRIGKIGCERLSQLFSNSLTKIEQLNLQENNLLDNAGAILIEHLLKFNNLKKLNLNKNYMGTKFALRLKEVLLGGDKNLVELYLSWNQFNSKAVRHILEGVSEHSYLKVFDFSWNKIDDQNTYLLAKIFEQASNLVHADFSFCEIRINSVIRLSKALQNNHTLYGLHFQGNSGFLNFKGNLIHTEKQFSEYPLPIIKGVIRRIDGIRPNQDNEFMNENTKDVCWICQSWQQKYFEFPYTAQLRQLAQSNKSSPECYIHLKHEHYNAVKMYLSEAGDKFEISRMCPISNVQFFFNFSLGLSFRKVSISNSYQKLYQQLPLRYYMGKLEFNETIQIRNYSQCQYQSDPLDQSYNPNVQLVPRSQEVRIQYKKGKKVILKQKRKVVREEKVKVNLKNLDNDDDEFLKDRTDRDGDQVYNSQYRYLSNYIGAIVDIQDFIKKCIDFDIQNSKITRLIKDPQQLQQFKLMMQRHYVHFKDAFYYLARSNPNAQSIFSINQLDFTGFLQEQKYITKRVTLAKIMLKLYACLANGQQNQAKIKKIDTKNSKNEDKTIKLFSRPQFLQFLIRLAIEKWCSFNPKKIKKPQKETLDDDYLLKPKKSFQKKVIVKQVTSAEKQANKKLVQQQQQKKGNKSESQHSQQEQQMKINKLQLPLALIDGLERTMSTLCRYSQHYRSSQWRRQRYLKSDILIVIKAYDQFLNSLFEKYSESRFKTNKPKRLVNLITLEELRAMMLDTDIKRTKEAMKQVDQSFLDSKRLEYEDGNINYGLNYNEFVQSLARISESVWFNPPSAHQADLWNSQINRKNTPLFLKFQALIITLYWRTSDLHNRRMTRIAQKGIFEVEISLLMQKIESLSKMTGSFGNIRKNSIFGEEQISLKQITEELRQKYDNMVIHHEQQEQYEVEHQIPPSR